ncbi:MAG: drug/metabolite transporter (DMT)-like permease [Motiliproteus sp.]|jgi:drug/metabolite transporter (DMT)-like permease
MSDSRKGLSALHLGSLLLGGTALFSKLIDTSALEITLWRSFIAAAVLWILLLLRGSRVRLGSAKDYGIAVLLGVVLAVHWVTYFHSMQVSSVAIGIIAFFSHPVISALLEPLFARQRPRLTDLLTALWVLCGIIIMLPQRDLDSGVTQGVLWGLLSALLFSVRNIIYKRYFSHYDSAVAMLYQCLVVGVVLLPLAGDFIFTTTLDNWLGLLVLGVLFTAIPHTLFSFSLKSLSVKTASLIMCLVPLYATMLAALLLAEIPSAQTLIGGVMILGAAIVESFKSGKQLRMSRQASENC